MGRIIKKKKIKKKFLLVVICCFLVSCVTSFFLCRALSPKIEIEDKVVTLKVGDKFEEPEYKAYYNNKDVTGKVKKTGKVNNKKLGTYVLKYTIDDYFLDDVEKVVVNVVDEEAPSITLEGGDSVNVCPGKDYVEPGYKADDNYDGDLTKKVVVTLNEKKTKATYVVSDSSSNSLKVVREIAYQDVEKPSITLEGDSAMTIYVGDSYSDPGYKASDNCDGDITSKVSVVGEVNTGSAGTYEIVYKVSDSSNNEESVTRTVKVLTRSLIRPQGGGSGRGIVYLTFDDGPNDGTTNVILDILKSEGVPATFFVTCNGPDYLISRMHNEGHTVALHTASHDYAYVYSSMDNYFADLNRVSERVQRITGVSSKIIRFPGGSSNTVSRKYNAGIMTRLTQEVVSRGYKYFDWNVDSNDAAGAGSGAIYNNVIGNVSINKENVVLMHDVKSTTRDALRSVIQALKGAGYTFARITDETVMVTHGVNN